MKAARATIKGFEIMRVIRPGHLMQRKPGVTGEVGFISDPFRPPASMQRSL